MLSNTKQVQELTLQEQLIDPAFPEEFQNYMIDLGYETLKAELERLQVDRKLVDLLDDIVMLSYQPKDVTWATNQVMFEGMGHLTHTLIKLRVQFVTPNGMVIGR